LSDIFIYIRLPPVVKPFFECEFAQGRSRGLKLWNPWKVRKEKIPIYGIPVMRAMCDVLLFSIKEIGGGGTGT
jgi:hypothetical protein